MNASRSYSPLLYAPGHCTQVSSPTPMTPKCVANTAPNGSRYKYFWTQADFRVAAQRLLDPKPHVYHGATEIDGIPVRDKEHTYLLISHVSHLEPTFPIAPEQTPLLDTLSVVEIGPMTAEGLMGVMHAVYAGSKHKEMEGVSFRSGVRKVEFTVDENEQKFRRICIDGEIYVVENGSFIGIEVGDMNARISV